MNRQWLSVIGLGLDFFGFLLIAREWYIATHRPKQMIESIARKIVERRAQAKTDLSERFQAESKKLRERMKAAPTDSDSSAVQDALIGLFDKIYEVERSGIGDVEEQEKGLRSVRTGWFLTGAIIISFGWVGQIAGSWPTPIAVPPRPPDVMDPTDYPLPAAQDRSSHELDKRYRRIWPPF